MYTPLTPTDSLPEKWGTKGAFAALATLDISHNQLEGALPSSWGGAEAFSQLQQLFMQHNRVTGRVPASWSAEGALVNMVNNGSMYV